jgi:hypothetical protein
MNNTVAQPKRLSFCATRAKQIVDKQPKRWELTLSGSMLKTETELAFAASISVPHYGSCLMSYVHHVTHSTSLLPALAG